MKTFEKFLQIILAAVESLAHSVSARIGAGRTKVAWSVATVLVASQRVQSHLNYIEAGLAELDADGVEW